MFGNHWTGDRPACWYSCSNGKPENTNYAVYGFILPSYRATPCRKTKVSFIKSYFSIMLGFGLFCIKEKKNETWNACPVLQYVLPSVLLSQKHELAVCKPAPFFWSMMHVTGWTNIRDCIQGEITGTVPLDKYYCKFNGLLPYLCTWKAFLI